ncbi:MAG: VTT domain-containing protein [Pseudomonadota bacterium]
MEAAEVQRVIATYGYLALFAGTFLEGEIFFILGGVAAGQGLLDPVYVALAALAGAVVGDNTFFWLGYLKGARLLARPWRLGRKVVLARALVRRHAVPLMLLSRFLYGLRMVVPLACGTSGVRPWRFLLLNLASALAWTLCFSCLGYFFGTWIVAHLGAVKGLQMVALLLVAVVALGALITRQVRRRFLASAAAGPPPPTS